MFRVLTIVYSDLWIFLDISKQEDKYTYKGLFMLTVICNKWIFLDVVVKKQEKKRPCIKK